MSEQTRIWAKRLKEQERSGLSQAAYCRRENLNEKQFYYWRRKAKDSNESKGKFIEVSGASKSNFELHLQNGLRVNVPVNFEEEGLKKLLEVLGC